MHFVLMINDFSILIILQLESEQLMKESKIREQSHQFAIPGEKIKQSSLARGMAECYEQKL